MNTANHQSLVASLTERGVSNDSLAIKINIAGIQDSSIIK